MHPHSLTYKDLKTFLNARQSKTMTFQTGTLIKNEKGDLCLKMQISPQNPNFYEIPLEELLEDYLGKKIAFELFEAVPRWEEENDE